MNIFKLIAQIDINLNNSLFDKPLQNKQFGDYFKLSSTLLIASLLSLKTRSAIAKKPFEAYTTIPSATDNYSYTGADDSLSYTFGNGVDLNLDSITAGDGKIYTPKELADRIFVRRVDNGLVTGERCNIFVERSNSGTGNINSAASFPRDGNNNCSIAEVLRDLVINRGVLDTFSNSASGTSEKPNNIERLDFVYSGGIVAPSNAADLDEAGHIVMEKNGNNPAKVAAITAIDAAGNPTAFSSTVVTVNNSDYGKTGVAINNNFLFDASTSGGATNPEYTENKSEQIGGVLVTLADFGISAGQTYYGFAMFGTDVPDNANLLQPQTFPLNTPHGSGNTGGADWQGGMGGFWSSLPPGMDYGDAPISYDDTADNDNAIDANDNPASHAISSNLHLGAVAGDAESTPQNSPNADADDNANDDEDAFATLPDASAGGNYILNVPLVNTLGSATLHGWIDLDSDGKFEAGEHQSIAVSNNDTTAALNWTIPNTAVGNTQVRLRLTSDTLTDDSNTIGIDERSIGNALDGEVEDYQIAIANSLGNISGTVFEDVNQNNIKDASESPLANVDIALFPDLNNDGIINDDPNGDGQITFADAVGRMDSDANGNYNFDAPDGNYLVYIRTNDTDLVRRPYGGVVGVPNDPLNSRRNADIVGANTLSGLDFPFDPLNISGTIYDDVNRNDVRDSFENPLANIFVALFRDINDNGILDAADDPDGDGLDFDDAVDQMNSNANGDYGFIVPDGNYLVFVNTNDSDLAGRTYGGVVNVPNDPLNSIRNADISGANILSGLDYPFDQQPPDICDAGDPTDQVNFLNNPNLIEGSPLQIGAVYRFDTVFDNIDALVKVVRFNNGATLGAMDNNSTGESAAFQPTLNATAGNATSSVDFEIRLIDKITGLPAVMNFKAAGVDIDGDGNQLREFIELSNIMSFTLDPNTTIDATSNPPITRFESNTINTQPGISTSAVTTLAVTQYNNTSQFNYSIGAINQGSTTALTRLNSLYIGCAKRVESDLDYGDAPDTYGTDNTVGNSSNTSDPLGAIHLINPDLFLGATVPDAENNGFVDGTDDNANATDDDASSGTGTGNGDDEDNFALPNLRSGDTSYTIPASTLTATNNTGEAATLHAWIDFDNSGTFEDTEHASVTVDNATNNGNPTGNLTWSNINVGSVGNTYARFRLTTDSAIDNTTPGGGAIDGEVEDYQIAIAPALLCPAAKADLWFANDESGSVDAAEFNNALDFIYQISDGFVYDDDTGMKAGITGWVELVNSVNIVMPITESFGDSDDFGLFSNGNISLNNNSQGIRELYKTKQNSSPGTRLDRATNYLADLIIAGNGRRSDTPQVAIMLTDADSNFIEDSGQGGFINWINEANRLKNTADAQIILVLIDEAATAYSSGGFSKIVIDNVAGPEGKVITVPSYTDAADSTRGYVEEVSQAICELSTPTASDPGLLLVKRITAINPGQPDQIQFNDFVDDPNSTQDNHPLWPDSDEDSTTNTNLYLRGVLDGGRVKPGDEVEYTIYFLSNGDEAAQQVNICDVVPDHLTFVKDAYGQEIGMALGYDPNMVRLAPNKLLSNLINQENNKDDAEGDFYGARTAPPANLCKKVDANNSLVDVDGSNNDNGAIIVRPATSLPAATSPGQPAGSYGFIRFRGKVK